MVESVNYSMKLIEILADSMVKTKSKLFSEWVTTYKLTCVYISYLKDKFLVKSYDYRVIKLF